jgi:methyl-accepting chemotaxis protein
MHVAGTPSAALSAGLLAGGSAVGFALSTWLTRSTRTAAAYARSISDNTAMQKVYTGFTDEGGQLLYTMKLLQGGLRTVLGRIQESAGELRAEAEHTADTTRQTSEGIQQQQSETALLATAMEEMSATVKEVAQNTVAASDSAEQADALAATARQAVKTSIDSCRSLEKEIARASEVISRLESDSETIGSVIDVIRGIAEQTNLLALNAAIEAARAGEQGRGFAVVADEVRTLASRTQESTGEIHNMIASLQTAARESVASMNSGSELARASVQYAGDVGSELDAIVKQAAAIKDMSIQIASAVEEQSAVSEEISRNVHNINDVADATAGRASTTAASAQCVAQHASGLQSLVSRFRNI